MTNQMPETWSARDGHAPHYQGQVADDTGATIAITYHDEGGTKARLCAAAPKLLAALKMALRYVPRAKHARDTREVAREAIAITNERGE